MISAEPHQVDGEPVEASAPVPSAPVPSEPGPGDRRVDAALRRAAELATTSPTEHVEIYEDVHRTLQEVLADASGQPPAAATEPPEASAEAGDAVR